MIKQITSPAVTPLYTHVCWRYTIYSANGCREGTSKVHESPPGGAGGGVGGRGGGGGDGTTYAIA